MALTVTNSELRGYVGRFFGAGDTPGSFVGEQSDDVQRFVDEGKRRMYAPDCQDGEEMWQWSFLTPTVHFDLVSGQNKYELPADFALLRGPIHYSIGSEEIRCPIAVTAPERVQYKLQSSNTTGLPMIAAVRPLKQNEGNFLDAMRYELIVYPTPDQDYSIDLTYKINPLAPTGNTLLPIGDQAHVQTLIEACLAAAERFNGEVNGPHEQEFQRRLRASISHDRQVACPDALGPNLDASDRDYYWGNDWQRRGAYGSGIVTYNGVAP
jgi:hypothetical protein